MRPPPSLQLPSPSLCLLKGPSQKEKEKEIRLVAEAVGSKTALAPFLSCSSQAGSQ